MDPAGTVTAARPVRPGDAPALERIEGRVIGTRLALAWPEGAPHPHVRRGALACSSATPCSLVLDTVDRPGVGGNP